MTQLYRIEEMCTSGWTLVESDAIQLTREQCKEKLEMYIAEGKNPNALRAVYDND